MDDEKMSILWKMRKWMMIHHTKKYQKFTYTVISRINIIHFLIVHKMLIFSSSINVTSDSPYKRVTEIYFDDDHFLIVHKLRI
jgi:thioester reductase-like protein